MLSELWNHVWTQVYLCFLRPMLKWALRKVTGKCELLRIAHENHRGAALTKQIEKSIKLSRNEYLKQLANAEDVNLDEAVPRIMSMKYILGDVHPNFENTLRVCLCHICGYKHLQAEVEVVRKTPYSAENPDHEKKLMQLWEILMPHEKLESRISKEWGRIGFQGDDPKTDFRGMGMLGLEQLLFFAMKYTEQARKVLSNSYHPHYEYAFAIVGINLSHVLYDMLKNRKLRTHFYNLADGRPDMQDYHQVFCYLFHEFDIFWSSEKPKDIMEFGRLRNKFKKRILQKLKEPMTVLESDFQKMDE